MGWVASAVGLTQVRIRTKLPSPFESAALFAWTTRRQLRVLLEAYAVFCCCVPAPDVTFTNPVIIAATSIISSQSR